MADEDDSHGRRRRDFLKIAGGTTAVGLAGYAGSASVLAQNGDWPDLSGTDVHVVIDETADPVQNYWNGVTTAFGEATNADVRVEYVGRQTSGVQRVTQLIQAGSPPEVFAMNQNNATAFHNADVLAPVSDTLTRVEDQIGQADKHVRFAGEDWLVPMFFNVTAWYWRGDLAREVGMDERPDWTWDQAIEYAEQVDQLDGVRGTYVPAGSGAHSVFRLRAWMNSNEVSTVTWEDDRMVVNFHQGENRSRMIELLDMLAQRHQYSPVASDSTFSSWARAIPNGVSGSGNYIGYRPKMYAVQDDREFAADVHAAQMPAGRSRLTDGNVDGLGTFRGSNVDAGRTFIEFATQPSTITDLYTINPVHDVPPYPDIRNSDAYQQFLAGLPDAYTEEDTRAYQERVATNFQTSIEETDPANPYAGTISGADALPNLVAAVVLDGADPDSVLDQYAESLQSTLDQAQS